MLLKYIVSTENSELVLSLKERWSIIDEFKMYGWLDLDNSMNPNDCRSLSDGRVFVDGALITFCSVTQIFVILPLTETEISAGIMVAQDMLYVYHYHLLELLELSVELELLLEIWSSRYSQQFV